MDERNPFTLYQLKEVFMRNLKLLLAAAALTSSLAYGDTAIFRDGVLHVPAVVNLGGDQVHYFGDVTLEVVNGREFRLMEAHPRTLATIDAMSVTVIETEPVSVTLELAGVFSDPCVSLEPISVTREGNTFQVVVAEVPPNPAAICIAAVVPFEVEVPLDVSGLFAGNYLVYVNGDVIDFDLE
jgi:hypothetical protein